MAKNIAMLQTEATQKLGSVTKSSEATDLNKPATSDNGTEEPLSETKMSVEELEYKTVTNDMTVEQRKVLEVLFDIMKSQLIE